MNRNYLILVGLFLILGPACAKSADEPASDVSTYSVARFSTIPFTEGGVREKLDTAFSGIDGYKGIFVGYHSYCIEVFYDSQLITDSSVFSTKIEKHGYPVIDTELLTSKEGSEDLKYKQEQAAVYIAKIGNVYLTRADLNLGLETITGQYKKQHGEDFFTTPDGKLVYQDIKGEILTALIDDTIWIAEMDRRGYSLSRAELDARYVEVVRKNKMSSEEELKNMINSSGYNYDYFKLKNVNLIKIDAFVEDTFFLENQTPDEQKDLRQKAYEHARDRSKIVFFDRELDGFYVERDCGCDD